MKKIPEKLSKYAEYDHIKSNLKNAIYDSLYLKDFEENLQMLIEEYNLEQNTWLGGLYEERHRWVPTFVKDTFWAGMSTTQRSESMNAFFNNYVTSETTLKEFFSQYENDLRKKVQKEEHEDFRCLKVQIELISPFKIEEQFQEAYMLENCKDLREQICQLIGCFFNSGLVVGGIQEFNIDQKSWLVRKKICFANNVLPLSILMRNQEKPIAAAGCLRVKGMVCAHMILVWGHKNAEEVPDKHILRRWKKNLLRSHKKVKVSYANWEQKPEWL